MTAPDRLGQCDAESDSLTERELAGAYDADNPDDLARDREPGPLTIHGDPLADGVF